MSAALDRNIRFMTDPDARGVLIRAFEFGADDVPTVELDSFSIPKDILAYCDQLITWLLRFREAHAYLNDDWMPVLRPRMGIAEFSSFLGGEVKIRRQHELPHPSSQRYLRLAVSPAGPRTAPLRGAS